MDSLLAFITDKYSVYGIFCIASILWVVIAILIYSRSGFWGGTFSCFALSLVSIFILNSSGIGGLLSGTEVYWLSNNSQTKWVKIEKDNKGDSVDDWDMDASGMYIYVLEKSKDEEVYPYYLPYEEHDKIITERKKSGYDPGYTMFRTIGGDVNYLGKYTIFCRDNKAKDLMKEHGVTKQGGDYKDMLIKTSEYVNYFIEVYDHDKKQDPKTSLLCLEKYVEALLSHLQNFLNSRQDISGPDIEMENEYANKLLDVHSYIDNSIKDFYKENRNDYRVLLVDIHNYVNNFIREYEESIYVEKTLLCLDDFYKDDIKYTEVSVPRDYGGKGVPQWLYHSSSATWIFIIFSVPSWLGMFAWFLIRSS